MVVGGEASGVSSRPEPRPSSIWQLLAGASRIYAAARDTAPVPQAAFVIHRNRNCIANPSLQRFAFPSFPAEKPPETFPETKCAAASLPKAKTSRKRATRGDRAIGRKRWGGVSQPDRGCGGRPQERAYQTRGKWSRRVRRRPWTGSGGRERATLETWDPAPKRGWRGESGYVFTPAGRHTAADTDAVHLALWREPGLLVRVVHALG